MRHQPIRSLALLLILALALASCGAASTKTLLVTGESIDATGRQFVAVGGAMNALLDAKHITSDQYRPWATFATHFKATFPVVVAGWRKARATQDATAEQEAAAKIRALGNDLARFAAQAYLDQPTAAQGGAR